MKEDFSLADVRCFGGFIKLCSLSATIAAEDCRFRRDTLATRWLNRVRVSKALKNSEVE